jgi:deoxycytidine triphosphate deaminase
MLSDKDIMKAIELGHISIGGFVKENLGSNSYDLRLAPAVAILAPPDKFSRFTDMHDKDRLPGHFEATLPLTIMPGESLILMTEETITLDGTIAGLLSQRSNLARYPLHLNFSLLVDSGFSGRLTACLTNNASYGYKLWPGERFLQIMFFANSSPVAVEYKERKSSKNLDQDGSAVPTYKIDKRWLKPFLDEKSKRGD